MRVLGIETSCDETAVAVVDAPAGDRPIGRILANVIYSQLTDCDFGPTGNAVLPNNGQCNAGKGYDGPTGVGVPKGLNLFKPLP